MNEITLCARCGASLKYSFEYNGKIYGSECIMVVTGLRSVPVFGETVVRAIGRQAAQDVTREEIANATARHEARRAARINALRAVINKLRPATGTFGNFESDMRESLQRGEALSDKQARIVCKIIKDQSAFDLLIGE